MDDVEQPSEEILEVSPEEPPKEPSKFTLFMRKLLRWGTGTLAIFTLGIVLTWIVQVSPRIKEIRDLEVQLDLASLQISDLEYEVSESKDTEEANTQLGESLEAARLHLSILSIFVDVSSAEIALTYNSPETALEALAETNAKLTALSIRLDDEHSETINAMQNRLNLVLDEIIEDAFAAQSDLEVLRNSILTLERSLFGN